MREVDELILLNINSTNENREPDYESIKEFSQECFIPFTVGDGIKSIEKDGTEGYDIDLIKEFTDNVKKTVIASGGAGDYEDLFMAINKGEVSAVAAASIFHFTEKTPREAKMFLASKGVPVRK